MEIAIPQEKATQGDSKGVMSDHRAMLPMLQDITVMITRRVNRPWWLGGRALAS